MQLWNKILNCTRTSDQSSEVIKSWVKTNHSKVLQDRKQLKQEVDEIVAKGALMLQDSLQVNIQKVVQCCLKSCLHGRPIHVSNLHVFSKYNCFMNFPQLLQRILSSVPRSTYTLPLKAIKHQSYAIEKFDVCEGKVI